MVAGNGKHNLSVSIGIDIVAHRYVLRIAVDAVASNAVARSDVQGVPFLLSVERQVAVAVCRSAAAAEEVELVAVVFVQTFHCQGAACRGTLQEHIVLGGSLDAQLAQPCRCGIVESAAVDAVCLEVCSRRGSGSRSGIVAVDQCHLCAAGNSVAACGVDVVPCVAVGIAAYSLVAACVAVVFAEVYEHLLMERQLGVGASHSVQLFYLHGIEVNISRLVKLHQCQGDVAVAVWKHRVTHQYCAVVGIAAVGAYGCSRHLVVALPDVFALEHERSYAVGGRCAAA